MSIYMIRSKSRGHQRKFKRLLRWMDKIDPFKNANDFSNPSDKSFGVVVNVKTDVLNTKNVNLNVKNPPVINPSLVILIIQNVIIGVPGLNKIFNTIVNTSKNNIPFIPLIIFANGTLDIFIIIAKNITIASNPIMLFVEKIAIINIKVPNSFTLGSNL